MPAREMVLSSVSALSLAGGGAEISGHGADAEFEPPVPFGGPADIRAEFPLLRETNWP